MSRKPARLADAFLEETSEELPLELAASLLVEAAPQAPSDGLRARLMTSLSRTHRFDDLEGEVARLLDLSSARASELLLGIDSPDVWTEGPGPGIRLYHVDGGPQVANAITGFIRMAPGVGFPEHEHVGDETLLILSGSLELQTGAIHGPGDVLPMPAGSRHSFRAIGDVRLLFLTVVQEGVIIGGHKILPGDPRA